MTPVTRHFHLEEFAVRDQWRTPYPFEWIADRLVPLCEMLEVVRQELGGHAITVLSGYRSIEHNIAVGGVKDSQHMQGRAADIVIAGMSPRLVQASVMMLVRAGKLLRVRGIGHYETFTHLDIRPTSKVAVW